MMLEPRCKVQSYAILDARTPGTVNIVSNKDCN